MNDPTSPLPVPEVPGLTLEALADAYQGLRTALHVTLVMLVILCGALFVFFLREVSLARRQINELAQVVADYQKSSLPLMEDFRTKLQVFTRAHPDFAPLYAKYFGSTNAAPLTQSSGRAQPVPANSNAARLPPSP
jgi:hypothetical protein